MLVYLLLVFTCGWSVCWLIFFGYQQNSAQNLSDDCLLPENYIHNSNEALIRQRSQRRRRRNRRRLQPFRAFAALRSGFAGSEQVALVESVVNESGEHSVLLEPEEFEAPEGELLPEEDDSCVLCVGQLRGWPEGAQFEVEAAGESCGTLESEWPVVGVHENPLGSLSSDSGIESSLMEDEDSTLCRSQLLSLRDGQRDKRAAIRMVSRRCESH